MSAEDEDMSNALMNDMADALRSAGLVPWLLMKKLFLSMKQLKIQEESIPSEAVDAEPNEERATKIRFEC